LPSSQVPGTSRIETASNSGMSSSAERGVAGAALPLVGCEEGAFEEAGEEIDDAADDVGDEIDRRN
jgi:hypothetical protein